MSVTFNTQTMKYREDETDPWSPLTVHIDASVDAVVQDEEPTGSENVWFDTSDTTEVSVPTMTDFNTLKNSFVVETVTTDSFTINANSVSYPLKSVSKSGYNALGIVGFSLNNSGLILIDMFLYDNNTKVTFTIKNATSSAVTSNAKVYILYQKI